MVKKDASTSFAISLGAFEKDRSLRGRKILAPPELDRSVSHRKRSDTDVRQLGIRPEPTVSEPKSTPFVDSFARITNLSIDRTVNERRFTCLLCEPPRCVCP